MTFRLRRVHPLFGCALLLALSGCGGKNQEAAFKGPVTVEQAVSILDLSSFQLANGATPPWPRGIASLAYQAPGDVKSVFEFHRKKLLSLGWKELPNSSVTAQTASATFSRKGFVVSVSVYPTGQSNSMAVSIQNLGNIKPSKLPMPPSLKPVYVGDASAIYVTDAGVAETAEACRKLLLDDGWVPYGAAGDSSYYKQHAIRISATVASAPAQGGKTMISYSSELMSADLPAPPDAPDLRYTESTKELSFEAAVDKQAVVDFYKKTLGKLGWEPTLEHLVQVGDREEMIFRNSAKDMLTLAMPARPTGKIQASLQQQSAAEIAELDRQLKEHAPAIKPR